MRDREREILHEAFTAGWQAALAVRIKDPRVMAIVESCFDMWLEEEVDEVAVLGIVLRRRHDLPRPVIHQAAPRNGSAAANGRHRAGDVVVVDGDEEARPSELVATDLRALASRFSLPRRTAESNGR